MSINVSLLGEIKGMRDKKMKRIANLVHKLSDAKMLIIRKILQKYTDSLIALIFILQSTVYIGHLPNQLLTVNQNANYLVHALVIYYLLLLLFCSGGEQS